MSDTEMRELDAWIAENVMGWRLIDRIEMGWLAGDAIWYTGDGESPTRQNYEPTIISADAMDVLKKCAEKTVVVVSSLGDCRDKESKWVVSQVNGKRISGSGETLELAICKFTKELFSK